MVTPLIPPSQVSLDEYIAHAERKLDPTQRATAKMTRARRKNPASGRGSETPTVRAPKGGVE